MNKVRENHIVEITNHIRETLNKGTHRTVSRQIIYDTTMIIEELLEEINKPDNNELISKLADDTWAVAKKLEVSEECNELKKISGCLHDIRAGRDTDWYKK